MRPEYHQIERALNNFPLVFPHLGDDTGSAPVYDLPKTCGNLPGRESLRQNKGGLS